LLVDLLVQPEQKTAERNGFPVQPEQKTAERNGFPVQLRFNPTEGTWENHGDVTVKLRIARRHRRDATTKAADKDPARADETKKLLQGKDGEDDAKEILLSTSQALQHNRFYRDRADLYEGFADEVLAAAYNVLLKRRGTCDPDEERTASSEGSDGDNSKSDPSTSTSPSPKPCGILKDLRKAPAAGTAADPPPKTVRWAC
jgi:hypothetical protein